MDQGNYYYDPETCSFVKVETTWKDRLRQAAIVGGSAIVLAALLFWVADVYLVNSPHEQALEAENEELKEQLTRASEQMEVFADELEDLAEADRELYRTLFQAEPISDDVRQVGIGGTDPYADFDQFDGDVAELLRETAHTLDEMERKMNLQSSSFHELAEHAEQHEQEMQELPVLMPTEGPITSGYGKRYHPVLGVEKMHHGVDILVEEGTPIMAPGDGVVSGTGRTAAYGIYLDIDHPEAGYTTRYAHLSEVPSDLGQGQPVERGDTVAYSGNTGRTTGPHLHYEVRDLGTDNTNDPQRFFSPDLDPTEFHRLVAQTEQLRNPSG